MGLTQEFTKGFWKELPPFRLVLGICAALAVSTAALNGIGMGLATTFVLVCSNILISVLRKIIPDKVRIAAYIVIIAAFVVIVELLMQAYFYSLYSLLGIFIPLIVVNCIILGRAEAFASKHGVMESIMDGLGIGLGYTIALGLMGTLREIIGAGTIFGHQVFWSGFEPMAFFQKPAGAFVTLGLLLGVINLISMRKS